jgi:hypothetical protein
VINSVDYEFRTFRRWQVQSRNRPPDPAEDQVISDDIDSQTINLLTCRKYTIEGATFRDRDLRTHPQYAIGPAAASEHCAELPVPVHVTQYALEVAT